MLSVSSSSCSCSAADAHEPCVSKIKLVSQEKRANVEEESVFMLTVFSPKRVFTTFASAVYGASYASLEETKDPLSANDTK